MRVDDLRSLSLFDGLADHQLAELVEAGTDVRVQPGTELFHEGAHADFWWVLLDGTIDLVRRVGGEDVVVGRMDTPGRWAGGFRAWDEHGVYLATGRAVADGRLLRVPSEVLRERSSAWFSFGAHLIEGVYRTARTIESTARQRESLVSLGTLAAGLAHEINNPAAAAVRAAENLQRECDALLSSLGRLAGNGISAAQFTVLDELRRELGQRMAIADPLAAADLETAVSSWLTDHGVDRDWMIAPPLAAGGADLAWCERAAATLPGAALEPGLEWVASTVSVITLLAEVKESTRRIADLVAAVKSYSQLDRASIQSIDVRDGIESTLAILGYKLPEGVEVVRDYGADVPRIEAYAGELNQVWTNLIDNAIDAMGDVGTLRITTRADGEHVLVEIGDTGPGMPPAVAARAFEAFYTTKDVGKGTGLGLDIARRIVEDRHSGRISIHSTPGQTVLRVRLPVRPPANRPGSTG
ncbi:MAG TPA: ATP-binding protein [Micromonosporaceae bacterium]|nr:ATP-binding protein [Micromonosporaceae bacterium]